MIKRPTQDDSRENKQIEIFNLIPGPGRSNKYVEDATVEIKNKTYKIELKTSDAARRKISTSRDFGQNKIDSWKTVDAFIFSLFNKTDGGFEFVEHYFLKPINLEPFFEHVVDKINKGVGGRAGLALWKDEVKPILKSSNLPKSTIDAMEITVTWGTKLNDPRINWDKLKEWGGVKMDNNRLSEHLRELLAEAV